MKSRSVAIIGAGASGLVAAKVLLDDGFSVTLFDRHTQLGGIWSEDWAYADLKTQQVSGFMEYSDLPDPDAPDFVSWNHIHNYLQKYADLFHISERIRFQSTIISIDKKDYKEAALPWTLVVRAANGDEEQFEYDHVIIATGLFSNPYIPNFPGQDRFAGSILHSSALKSKEQLINKRVVVVGGGKSAADMATLAGEYATSCHMLFRRAHWLIPRHLLSGRLPYRYAYTRLMCTVFDPYPNAHRSALYYFIHRKFSSLISRIFDTMSADLIASYDSTLFDDKIFLPKGSFRNAENSLRISDEFIRLKRQGHIIAKLASIDEIIDQHTIRLDTGERLPADLIISATGFMQHFPFFSETLCRQLGLTSTRSKSMTEIDIDLYRRLVPVGVPNLAFLGFVSSAHQWLVTEVASHWISDYFLGRIKLPESEKMYEEIRTTQSFIRQQFNRSSFHHQYYWIEPIEIYLNDMGLRLHRTNNWISEYFGIYRSERLKTLHEERMMRARGRVKWYHYRHCYFGFRQTLLILLFFLISWFYCTA